MKKIGAVFSLSNYVKTNIFGIKISKYDKSKVRKEGGVISSFIMNRGSITCMAN